MKLKKLFDLKKRNSRKPRANEFVLESLESRLLLSAVPMTAAVVTTDHLDYAPRETAVITTSNTNGEGLQFGAGESVRFQVTRTDGMTDVAGSTAGVGPAGNEAWYVVDGVGGFAAHLGSDVSGDGQADWIAPDNDLTVNSSISTTWFVEEQYRNSSLLVTAEGQASGAVASQAFTDENVNTTTVVTASSATSIYGDDVTFTATVTPSVGASTRPVGTVDFFADGILIGSADVDNPLVGGLSSVFSVTLSATTFDQLVAGSYSIEALFTGGDNGIDSFNDSASGIIDHTVGQKDITGSFLVDPKVYDGTTAASVFFTEIDLGGVVGSDDVALSGSIASFADPNAGVGKPVMLLDGALVGVDAGNYNLTSVATTTADIDKADAILDVIGFDGFYDGNQHGATGTATGVLGEPLAGLDLSGTFFSTVGIHLGAWTFTDVTGNYTDWVDIVEIVLNEAATTTTISASTATSTYGDLVTLTATVTAEAGAPGRPIGMVEFFDGATSLGSTSVSSQDLIDPLASVFTLDVDTLAAGPHSISAVFTPTTGFLGSASTAPMVVNVNKANAVVTGYSGVYDAAVHGATAVGVFGENLGGLSVPMHTDAGAYLDTFTFTDMTGNYNNATGSVISSIAKADATITVLGYTGVYDAAAHGATGSATGVLGVNL
ncbi:MAG: Ig-like domain repeat protein, partial [Nitrospira sp. CG24E]